MKTIWTKGLLGEQKEAIEASFISSIEIRTRLSKILQDKVEFSLKERSSKLTYDNPNWAYIQADHSGYERAMREILSILE